MEIKATLRYSNPQLIREFALPKEFTAKQLYQAICISTEWDTRRDATFYRNGKVLEDSAKIAENLFEEDATLACVVGNVEQPDWYWRIEQVESPDPTLQPKWPILIRHRGGTILNRVKSVYEMNRYQNGWYSSSDKITLTIINAKLEDAFGKKGIKEVAIANLAGQSCTETLSQMTVKKLKEIEELLDLDHEATLLKKQRIEQIALDYSTNVNVMKKIIEEMSMIEYKVFCAVFEEKESAIINDEEDQMLYHTLLYYGLVTIGNNGKVMLSFELIRGATPLMNDVVKDELKRKHVASTVIEAGTQLYGFVNKQLYNVLLESCYSGILTEEQKEAYWMELIQKAQRGKTRFIWMQYFSVFARPDADLYFDIISSYYDTDIATLPFYMPEQDLAETIDLYWTTVDIETVGTLLKSLKERFSHAKDYIHQYTYAAIQKCLEGETPENAMRSIFISFGAGARGKGIAQMTLELKKVLSKIRQPRYFGHTQEEYEALTGGKRK